MARSLVKCAPRWDRSVCRPRPRKTPYRWSGRRCRAGRCRVPLVGESVASAAAMDSRIASETWSRRVSAGDELCRALPTVAMWRSTSSRAPTMPPDRRCRLLIEDELAGNRWRISRRRSERAGTLDGGAHVIASNFAHAIAELESAVVLRREYAGRHAHHALVMLIRATRSVCSLASALLLRRGQLGDEALAHAGRLDCAMAAIARTPSMTSAASTRSRRFRYPARRSGCLLLVIALTGLPALARALWGGLFVVQVDGNGFGLRGFFCWAALVWVALVLAETLPSPSRSCRRRTLCELALGCFSRSCLARTFLAATVLADGLPDAVFTALGAALPYFGSGLATAASPQQMSPRQANGCRQSRGRLRCVHSGSHLQNDLMSLTQIDRAAWVLLPPFAMCVL